MALIPRRNPLTSLLNFAADRDREANSIGDIITQIAGPALGQMGVKTEETAQPAVMRGPVPSAQPLGAMTGPAMAPTLVDQPVSDDFMRRLVKQESGGNPNAVSPKGATGLTQVMPSTAVDPGYGVPSIFDLADEQGVDYGARTQDEAARLLFDPDLNYQFGNLYANAMSKRFGGDPVLTAAAYNAGPGAVEQYGGVPPWEETQNYVNAVAGGGGDARLGGGAGADTLGGNSVEALLAQLYPQMSPEDEKRQRRKDLFAAASQGFSALSQGRPIDFSNIQANQEARKRQAVLDMRERERARSAASLVYSQTGDSELATGIATGAISYNDVLTERQTRRANELADQQRIRDAESAEAIAAAMKRTGLYNEEDIAAVAAGTLSADQLGSVFEQGRLAEELRAEAETKAEVAAQNVIDAQMVLQSAAPGSTEARAAERVIALGGAENVYDIISARAPKAENRTIVKPGEVVLGANNEVLYTAPAAPGGDKSFQFQAEIDARVNNLGEDVATATRAVLNKPEAAGYSVVELPGGGVMVVPSATAGAPAQVAPAAVGAPTGVAGAFSQQFGGMETGIPTGAPAPAVAAQALPLDVAQGVADLENTLAQTALRAQELDEAIANAPDNATKLRLEGERIAIQNELDRLSLQQRIAAEPDVARKRELENELIELQIQNEADKAAATEAKADLRKQQREIRSNDTMRLLSDVYDRSLGFMSGPIPGFARGLIAEYFGASEAGQAKGQLEGVQVGIFTDQLSGMRESSQTGAAVGNVTDSERQAFASALGKLDVGGDPELLRQNLRAVANASLNLMHGTPDKLRAAVERGELDAETAERYGARYDIDGTADTGMVGELGPVVPLGIAAVDENVLSLEQAPIAELVAPDSPDPEYEASLIQNPALLYATTPDDYAKLSPAQKAVFDRLMEDSP
jgi:hypothetical protein